MLVNRDECIERLISDDIDSIKSDTEYGDGLLFDILNSGFQGYSSFTDTELVWEMECRGFEEELIYE